MSHTNVVVLEGVIVRVWPADEGQPAAGTIKSSDERADTYIRFKSFNNRAYDLQQGDECRLMGKINSWKNEQTGAFEVSLFVTMIEEIGAPFRQGGRGGQGGPQGRQGGRGGQGGPQGRQGGGGGWSEDGGEGDDANAPGASEYDASLADNKERLLTAVANVEQPQPNTGTWTEETSVSTEEDDIPF